MLKLLKFSCFVVLFVLVVSIFCIRLNTELSDNKLAQYRLDTAKMRKETAEIELDNALYKQWILGLQYKDLNLRDKWKEELEQLKQDNKYYE